MANDFEFELKGLDELRAKMKLVSDEAVGKGGKLALRRASEVVRKSAVAGAARLDDSKTANNISKNIVVRANSRMNKRSNGDSIGYRVGVLGGARDYSAHGEIKTGKSASENPGGDTFYWRFLEFGTQKIAARPFMRPALAYSVDAATDTFLNEMEKALDRAIKKGGKP